MKTARPECRRLKQGEAKRREGVHSRPEQGEEASPRKGAIPPPTQHKLHVLSTSASPPPSQATHSPLLSMTFADPSMIPLIKRGHDHLPGTSTACKESLLSRERSFTNIKTGGKVMLFLFVTRQTLPRQSGLVPSDRDTDRSGGIASRDSTSRTSGEGEHREFQQWFNQGGSP